MNVRKEKSDILKKVKIWTSLKEAPDLDDNIGTFDEGKEDKDPINFIVTLIVAISGIFTLKMLIAKIINNMLPEMETLARSSIINSTTGPISGETVPTTSYDIPVHAIDRDGKYKVSPQSAEGRHLYGEDTDSFDHKMYNVVSLKQSTQIGGMNISCSDGKNLSVTLSGDTMGDVTTSYMNDPSTSFFDKKSFTSKTMNAMFGTLDKTTKTKSQLIWEETRAAIFQNMINEESDPFVLDHEDRTIIEKNAGERVSGTRNLDLVCGVFKSEMSMDDMDDLVHQIGSAGTDEDIASALDLVFDKSINTGEGMTGNTEPAKEGFFRRLINTIKLLILELTIASPQVRLLLIILNTVKSGNSVPVIPSDSTDDLKDNKKTVTCILTDVTTTMGDFMIDTLKSEVDKLVKPAIKKIIKSLLQKKRDQIMSLILSR